MVLQFSSFAQSCLTLCDPMNRSTPGLGRYKQDGRVERPEFSPSHQNTRTTKNRWTTTEKKTKTLDSTYKYPISKDKEKATMR